VIGVTKSKVQVSKKQSIKTQDFKASSTKQRCMAEARIEGEGHPHSLQGF